MERAWGLSKALEELENPRNQELGMVMGWELGPSQKLESSQALEKDKDPRSQVLHLRMAMDQAGAGLGSLGGPKWESQVLHLDLCLSSRLWRCEVPEARIREWEWTWPGSPVRSPSSEWPWTRHQRGHETSKARVWQWEWNRNCSPARPGSPEWIWSRLWRGQESPETRIWEWKRTGCPARSWREASEARPCHSKWLWTRLWNRHEAPEARISEWAWAWNPAGVQKWTGS
ncbi:uncharacterized protein LOC107977228 [Cricetulus griseus]|uniref:Uncharacterized protein LOC107977228 n=1 Tax=Cricetulus griseus TaxID=10029 RepID=A0A9J7KA25_CRIGR|nr:uncharacterized protein LOC107977228 [Cricetulus griseus]XP_035303733.1 uncharacterized protein LOC107977228 [Cricetulus griseus]